MPANDATVPLKTLISTNTLAQLAAITGSDYHHERAVIAVQNALRGDADPLAQLVSAAAEVYMRVTPVKLPFRDLVWHAHHEEPVAIWSALEHRWFLITMAGWSRLRIVDGDHPRQRVTISRSALAKRLGLSKFSDEIEAGIVHPERPTQLTSIAHDRHEASKEHGHSSPVKAFWKFLKAEKQEVTTLLTFSVFSGLLYLAAPLAVDAVVSNLAFGGQSQPYIQAIVILALALLGALALQAVVSGFQYYVSDIIQRRIFVRTASDLAYRLPRVKADALNSVHAPELVNRFLDVVTVQKSTALLLLDGVNLVFSSLIGMLLLALYHPWLLLFAAVLLVSIVLLVWGFGKGAVKTSIDESRTKYDLVNWFEMIAGFPFLFKGPGGYDLAYDRANQLASEYVARRSAHFRILMCQIVALLALSVVASAALLVLGGYLVVSQQITLGQLVASELIMGSIVGALAKLGKKLEAWYDAMAAMDKLSHIFDLEIENEDGEQPAKRVGGAAVDVCEVSFGFSETPLFKNKSFKIQPGQRVAVVGPHGSGTSSMLDILFGLRTPQEGHVSVDGLDLRSWYLEALRESVQLLRRDEIVEGSIVDNLRLGRSDIGMDEIRTALEKVGLLDSLLHRPEGLKLPLKIGGAPLNANERTRLLLARALVQQPRLLLLDQMLDGLDEESFAMLTKAIFDRNLPWTVVTVTRDHDVTRLCDQIIKLAPCHLTDGTTPSEA
jgi:putative ABC transport system ATP-binding protein